MKPWQHQPWCLPTVGPEFVWRMEDLWDLYAAPPDPARPLGCFDERPVALRRDARPGTRCAPGRPARHDYEDVREGMGNLFVAVAPHLGWRHVTVIARRTARDVADQLRALVDEAFPEVEVIRVVLDNLNVHTPAVLYQTFPPAEARRIARKLELHYTPTHGSWLNMAELEWAVLERQCLDRRLATLEHVATEVAAWQAARNTARASITWRFTTATARTRLARLYPDYQA